MKSSNLNYSKQATLSQERRPFGRDEAAAGLEAAEVTVPLCRTLKEKDREELSEGSAEIPQLQIEFFFLCFARR